MCRRCVLSQCKSWSVFSGVHLYRLFIDDTGAGAARAVQAALSKVSTSEPLPLDSPAAGASEDGALLTRMNAVLAGCIQDHVQAVSGCCSPSSTCRVPRSAAGCYVCSCVQCMYQGTTCSCRSVCPAAICSQAAKRWWTAARAARRWLPRRCRRRRTTTARITSACRCSTSARCAGCWFHLWYPRTACRLHTGHRSVTLADGRFAAHDFKHGSTPCCVVHDCTHR